MHNAYSIEALKAAYPPSSSLIKAANDDGRDAGSKNIVSLRPHKLPELIYQPPGVDRSADTLRFAGEAARESWTREEVRATLLDPTKPISAHCLAQDNPGRAADRAIETAFADITEPSSVIIKASPYVWVPAEDIPPLDWLFGHWILRDEVSFVVAPGGLGKSTFLVGTALSLVTGRNILGKELPSGPMRVWLWNLEDSIAMMTRSIQATAKVHGINASELGDRLFLDSARDGSPLCTATRTRDGLELQSPVHEALVIALREKKIDVLIVDPFVSSHEANENDNGEIDKVAKQWCRVAQEANCAIILCHHTSKAGSAEVNTMSARGAVAMTAAARIVLVLNPMTGADASRLGVDEDERWRLVRVTMDKSNRAPLEKYALPTLFRSRNMIVSGDEKQMPPTNFFASRIESDEAEIYDGHDTDHELGEEERDAAAEVWNRREIKDCPDLLQLAKTVLPSTTLQIHYRSAYRELIQFSNASFYVNRLSVPARHPADEIRRVRPIEIIRADGIYEDQTNRTEAEHVADTLSTLWRADESKIPTVGVVTFNRKQADLIEEILEDRAESDAAFRVALARERDRVEGGEDMGFFVKNVENVQGDERDVIVFSSTFGRNAQGTFRRFFGVLGQNGGERRLNVAVTRARQKIILVTSMPIPLISDLLSTRRQAVSPRDFLQAYFEYARCMSDGDLEAASVLLTRLTPEQRRGPSRYEGLSDGLEHAVAAEFKSLGWQPSAVSDGGAFGLDFAIEDPRTGLYGIGIECDAPRHGLLETARARELWRPSVLRRSIPVIHRVSSHRWFHEPAQERERLRVAVTNALGAKA